MITSLADSHPHQLKCLLARSALQLLVPTCLPFHLCEPEVILMGITTGSTACAELQTTWLYTGRRDAIFVRLAFLVSC